ncbi:MAG: DUF4230 domain-containing protein [Flavobacteriales bacterium]|nr:DUF4230 domain-containing protein [Flavobacteriales bacterium]
MNKMKGLLVLVGVALLVFFITRAVYEPDRATEQVSSTVLLERIRPVLKLVTVEGDFNEIYSETIDEKNKGWLGKTSPFQKSAIVRVTATMSVGYDLQGVRLEADERTRTIRLFGPLKPQILSTEYSFHYYDMQEGIFTEFEASDISNIETKAKAKIISSAAKSGLFIEAAKGRIEAASIMKTIAESSGWTFVDASRTGTPTKD